MEGFYTTTIKTAVNVSPDFIFMYLGHTNAHLCKS